MAGDLHDNLIADFAEYPYTVLSAECSGNGMVDLEVTAPDGGTVPTAARCPRCQRQKLRVAIAEFVPPRFSQPVEVPEDVANWAKRGRDAQGLYLAGQVGTGKTHAAWMAVTAWCLTTGTAPRVNRGGYSDSPYDYGGRFTPNIVFARMTDLLDDFRPGDVSVQRVRDCQNAALLVIDDLGAEKPSEWTQERLYSVIDHRYANCMPLLVTGNLPPRKLAEQTGDRVASRLAEMCSVVVMTGADRRRAA